MGSTGVGRAGLAAVWRTGEPEATVGSLGWLTGTEPEGVAIGAPIITPLGASQLVWQGWLC